MHDSERKSLVLAGIVIVLVGASIAILVRLGPSSAAPAAAEEVLTRSRPELVRGIDNTATGSPRAAWARDLERRLRDKGQTCFLSTSGTDDRLLIIRWDENAVDHEHMGQLQRAGGFFDQLRSLGFLRLELRVGERAVWSKEL